MTESLDRDPLVLLYDCYRAMGAKFGERARARGMTRAQWRILAHVKRQPGLSQSELAAICEVEPITVARLVDRLEKSGLLERRPDPNDRRIWRLHNLAAAKPVLDEIAAYREELTRDIDAHIGRAAREAMVDALVAVKALMTGTDPLNEAVGTARKRSAAQMQAAGN